MLRKCVQLLSSLVYLTLFAKSQKIIPGHCPPVNPMVDFDMDRFMGVWYQQATFKSILKDEVTCTHFKYKPVEGGGFRVEARKMAKLTNGPVSMFGLARSGKYGKEIPGHYIVTFFGELVNEVSSYYVLQTDYKDTAVVWSCDEFYSFWNMQNVQVLTRGRAVNTTTLLVSALRALLPHHLDSLFDFLTPIDQSQCEEFVAA